MKRSHRNFFGRSAPLILAMAACTGEAKGPAEEADVVAQVQDTQAPDTGVAEGCGTRECGFVNGEACGTLLGLCPKPEECDSKTGNCFETSSTDGTDAGDQSDAADASDATDGTGATDCSSLPACTLDESSLDQCCLR